MTSDAAQWRRPHWGPWGRQRSSAGDTGIRQTVVNDRTDAMRNGYLTAAGWPTHVIDVEQLRHRLHRHAAPLSIVPRVFTPAVVPWSMRLCTENTIDKCIEGSLSSVTASGIHSVTDPGIRTNIPPPERECPINGGSSLALVS